ncbi:PQQ-binding-like beta-propeller repeat protein [Rubinisphaera sp.]|uniref:outer membrane protein assembly factor BamB family protein n=1 Tax=Rubinisphaera sp. TaxID=2024857 RepID=UPI0025E22B7F|nr:PQQ-binding-like beta-propeller repeat protein [Rubinisphaera sp.]|tara:strand:- start:11474 stop:13471 length:1998 start_codon:yes stop_codon:yes gene_type:complete
MIQWSWKTISYRLALGLMFASLTVWSSGCQEKPKPAPSDPDKTMEDGDHDHGDHDHDHDGDHEHGDHDDHDHSGEMKPESTSTTPPEGTTSEKPKAEMTPPLVAAPESTTTEPPAPAETSAAKPEMKTPPLVSTPEATTTEPKPAGTTTEAKPAAPATAPKMELAKADNKPAETKPADGNGTVTGDWPMWGGDPTRNMVNKTTGVSLDFEPALEAEKGKNLIFTARLGSQTYGNPVVANGKVLVGTNNGGEYRPQHEGDRGVVLCFDDQTGEFLWQLTREKLPQGRVNDWPEQGICSTPIIEDNKVYLATNRCEVMCLDLDGFLDDENDGVYTEEVDHEKQDADIIWSLDMIDELGVFPHNLATSSPVIHGDYLFLVTSNGVDEAHLEIPAPRAPSFLCINKNTGEVVWESNEPFDQILHGQWSSPAIGEVNGVTQVYMPGGDGWLYAFDITSGEIIWKFDLNPKDSKWELGGRGTRNALISTPVFMDNSVVLSVGQDPEHGEGVGHIYRIDATKKGDISPVTPENAPNPNSGQIWHFGGVDEDGSITGRKGDLIYRRTISTVAIHDGLVYAPDLSGFLHCIDFKTGEQYWEYDAFAAIWGSPMVVDGKVFLGDEDGDLVVLKAGKEEEVLAEILFDSSIYSTPTIANGKIYVADRSRLYCFSIN